MLKKVKGFLFINNSIGQTLVKNTFWLFLGEIFGRVFKLIIVLYALRVLGVENWGIFSYAISITGLFFIFSDIGLNSLITREIAKNSKEYLGYISTTFFIKLTLLIISSLVLILISPHLSEIPNIRNLVIIMSLLWCSDAIREFGLALNRALEKMEIEALVKIMTNLSILVFGFLVLFLRPSVANLAYTYLAGSLLGTILIIFKLKKYFVNLLKYFSKRFVKPIIEIAWPFLIFSALGAIMVYTDTLMLGWMKTPKDLGLYGAVQRVIQFLYIIPNLIALATFPLLAKLAKENKDYFKNVLEKIITIIMVFATPIMVGGIMLAKPIILVTLGPSYIEATVVFQIFLSIIIVMFPITMVNNYIFIENKQKMFVVYVVIGSILNVILNLYMIRDYGINGAAVSTAISSLFTNLVIWILTKKKVGDFTILPYMKNIIFATISMSIIVWLGKKMDLNLFINIFISSLVFFFILYKLKEPILKEARTILLKDKN